MQPTPARETKKPGKPQKTVLTVHSWAANNIFHFRMWDGLLYAMLYVLAPIFVTWISLDTIEGDLVAAAYCYFCIMLSASSCFHDALGRFEAKRRSVRNTKLRLILLASFIAFAYGLFQFLTISIGKTLDYRNDVVLYLYLPAVAVATIDFIALFGREECIVAAVRD